MEILNSSKPCRVFGIGEIVLDIVMRDGKPLAAVPGGSTFNSMISLGRTCPGMEIYMISQIGRDKVSDIVTDFMTANNVRSDYLCQVEGKQSTVSLAILNQQNDAQYEFFRDKNMPPFKAPDVDFRKGDVIIFGSFFAVSPETRKETQALVKKAKEAGAIVYYDVNFRKSHMIQLSEVLAAIEENMRLSDIVRASSEDIFNIYNISNSDEVFENHISKFCKNFICTQGADITHFYSLEPGSDNTTDNNDYIRHDYVPVTIETVSTIGAGDNFNAGFVYGLINKGLSEETVDLLIKVASEFSSNVCQSLYNYVDEGFYPDKYLCD